MQASIEESKWRKKRRLCPLGKSPCKLREKSTQDRYARSVHPDSRKSQPNWMPISIQFNMESIEWSRGDIQEEKHALKIWKGIRGKAGSGLCSLPEITVKNARGLRETPMRDRFVQTMNCHCQIEYSNLNKTLKWKLVKLEGISKYKKQQSNTTGMPGSSPPPPLESSPENKVPDGHWDG